MSGWLESSAAARRVRKAGFSETDLAQWAEEGKLRTRARKGRFASAEHDEEREFPPEPPADPMDREVLGLWPDIPKEFWHWINSPRGESDSRWGAGAFAATIFHEPDHDQRESNEGIKLFGVTFNEEDLDGLLNPTQPQSTVKPRRWHMQKPRQAQKDLFKFLEFAGRFLPGGRDEKSKTDLRLEYVKWLQQTHPNESPLRRSAFEDWLKRHQSGSRIVQGRWKDDSSE